MTRREGLGEGLGEEDKVGEEAEGRFCNVEIGVVFVEADNVFDIFHSNTFESDSDGERNFDSHLGEGGGEY